MKISTETYKTFSYDIMFADKGDWGKTYKHTFYVDCEHNFEVNHFKSYEEVKIAMEKVIDSFLANVPTTVEELVTKLSDLIVWTGYEDAHFDEKAAKLLIDNFLLKQRRV